MTVLIVLWIFNLGVCIWNIYAIGNTWVEARHAGGWMNFAVWSGAIVTALGLTWNILVLEAMVAFSSRLINEIEVQIMLQSGYILIIPGILFGGYAVTFDAWAQEYRSRITSELNRSSVADVVAQSEVFDVASTGGGVADHQDLVDAAINVTARAAAESFARSYNSYHAVDGLGKAIESVFGIFTDDDDSIKIGLILLLLAVALGMGFILTAIGIWYFAARDELLPEPYQPPTAG